MQCGQLSNTALLWLLGAVSCILIVGVLTGYLVGRAEEKAKQGGAA